MSSVSNYYTQDSVQGQPSSMYYSNWNSADKSINSLNSAGAAIYSSDRAPASSSPPVALSPLQLMQQQQQTQLQLPQKLQHPHHQIPQTPRPPISPPPTSVISPTSYPGDGVPPISNSYEETSSDPNATKLSIEHFKSSDGTNNEDHNNNDSSLTDYQNNNSVYQQGWFWSIIFLILLCLIGAGIYSYSQESGSYKHSSGETFGSSITDTLKENLNSGGILNDLEFL